MSSVTIDSARGWALGPLQFSILAFMWDVPIHRLTGGRASIRIRGSKLLVRWFMLDGEHFPFGVVIEPDDDLAQCVQPEPWSPTLTAIQQAMPLCFESGMYYCTRPGSGTLTVQVVESESVLLEPPTVVAEASCSVEITRCPVVIGPLEGPAAPVPVSSPLRIRTPAGLQDWSGPGLAWRRRPQVTPDGPVEGGVAIGTGAGGSLTLSRVAAPLDNIWGPVGCDLAWSHFAADRGAIDSPLRFLDVRTAGELRPSGTLWFQHGLPDDLVARRPWRGVVQVEGTGTEPGLVEPAHTNLEVGIDPVTLELTLDSDDQHGGDLVLEDQWDPDQRMILGGLRIRVTRPADPPETLYDSDSRAAVYGTVSATEMVLQVVVPEDRDGSRWRDSRRASFRIRLTIENGNVACFQPPGLDPTGVSFQFAGDLKQILRAAGPGTSDLLVALEPLGEPLPEDCFQFEMPVEQGFVIRVPAPLECHINSWSDTYFAGQNQLNLSAPGPYPELIHATGTVYGQVVNHRPDSTSEQWRLRVHRPDGTTIDFDQDAVMLVADGSFVRWLTPERLQEGDNRFELWAWKPINEVVNGGPSIAERTLRGTRPRVQATVIDPQYGNAGRVVTRAVPLITWSWERALHASLHDQVGNGTPLELAVDDQVRYDRHRAQTTTARLSAAVGPHRVFATASNDFGESAGAADTRTAVAPQLTQSLSVPAGFAGKFLTPERVGNSVQRVTSSLSFRFAQQWTIRQGGATLAGGNPADPFAGGSAERDLPGSATELAVGDNQFSFRAFNEFASIGLSVSVNRRDRVFDVPQGSLTLDPRVRGDTPSDHDQYRVSWIMLLAGQTVASGEGAGVIITLPAGVELPSPLGFDSIQWTVNLFVDGEDHGTEDAPMLIAIDALGDIIGPDFEHLLAAFRELESNVQIDDPVNIEVRDLGSERLWLRMLTWALPPGHEIPVETVPL